MKTTMNKRNWVSFIVNVLLASFIGLLWDKHQHYAVAIGVIYVLGGLDRIYFKVTRK